MVAVASSGLSYPNSSSLSRRRCANPKNGFAVMILRGEKEKGSYLEMGWRRGQREGRKKKNLLEEQESRRESRQSKESRDSRESK
jgi:hypothetical protein